MASIEEMCEVAPSEVTPEGLKSEMEECEKHVEDGEWEAGIDEVFSRPDVNRTMFIWQVEVATEDSDVEDDWEKEDSAWRCLPQHWQTVLNARLAQYQSSLQDAQALYEYRVETFGANDVKTKNANQKLVDLQSGKGARSIVLMLKGSGKEVGQEVYRRTVQNDNGELKVSVSNKIQAYQLCVDSMKLSTLSDPVVERQLRIVSVTGFSRELQEVRLHLDVASLQSSNLMEGFKFSNSSSSSGKNGSTEEVQKTGGMEEPGDVAVLEDEFEAAEDGLNAIIGANPADFAEAGVEADKGSVISRLGICLLQVGELCTEFCPIGVQLCTYAYTSIYIYMYRLTQTILYFYTFILYTCTHSHNPSQGIRVIWR